jgi:hypothetical protein
MRLLLAAILAAAALQSGCAGMLSTPYDATLSCQAVGGSIGPDGVCQAGL